MRFKNNNKGNPSQIFLYKRVYEPTEGHKAHVVCGNVNELPKIDYEGMQTFIYKTYYLKTLVLI